MPESFTMLESGPGVADRLATRLMDMLADGRLAPGQRLPGERQLAEMMGASRVSVRAALQKLKARGLLTAERGHGTVVVQAVAGEPEPPLADLVRINPENLRDLAEIRAEMESWAVRRAALNARPEDLAEMDSLVARMSRARSAATKAELDVRFHLAIGRASASPVYMHVLSLIRDVLAAALEQQQTAIFTDPQDDANLLAQHRAIANALRARDGEAAASAMRGHIAYLLARYEASRRKK